MTPQLYNARIPRSIHGLGYVLLFFVDSKEILYLSKIMKIQFKSGYSGIFKKMFFEHPSADVAARFILAIKRHHYCFGRG